MRTKIYEIPGKVTVEYDSDAKAIIDTWANYYVSLNEYKEAIMIKGVTYAKTHGCKAWIIDSHQAIRRF